VKRLDRRIKVFGVGLSKTGTTSLAAALDRLGVPTLHYPSDDRTREQLERGDYRLAVLDRYQGVCDTPVAPFFAQLDALHPGARFVLTVREKEAWLRSCERHWAFADWITHRTNRDRRFDDFINACTYGVHEFQRERFSWVYDRHVEAVTRHFAGRPESLLVLDVVGGEGWEKLCPFLGLDAPSEPFPHANAAQDKRIVEAWIEDREALGEELSARVPEGAAVALLDEDRLRSDLAGGPWRLEAFPAEAGEYAGPPRDVAGALAALDRLRGGGPDYLAVAWPAFWWLEHYAGFERALRAGFACVHESPRVVLFDLRSPAAGSDEAGRAVGGRS
jgi:hypothetical protein